ncbi:MAG: hypothetical protein AB1611_15640 [bacterium]
MKSVKKVLVLSVSCILISLACASLSEAQYPLIYPPPEVLNPYLFASGLPTYYPLPAPLVSFPVINPFLPIPSPLSAMLLPPPAASSLPVRTAAQAGFWVGTWQSTFIAFIILYHSGSMTLELIENPLLQSISGTGILIGSRYTDTLFDVRGVLPLSTTFELNAILPGGYAIVLSCFLTSPTTMIGTYTVTLGFGGALVDKGIFDLSLV